MRTEFNSEEDTTTKVETYQYKIQLERPNGNLVVVDFEDKIMRDKIYFQIIEVLDFSDDES